MDERRARISVATCAVVLLLALPVIYFLSFGPIVWLIKRGYIIGGSPLAQCVEAVFSPMTWLADNFSWFHRLCDLYGRLWG